MWKMLEQLEKREVWQMRRVSTCTGYGQMNVSWVRRTGSLCRYVRTQTVLPHPGGMWSFVYGEWNPLGFYVPKPGFLRCWHQSEPNISFMLCNERENFPAKEGTDKCDSNIYYRAFHQREVIFSDVTSSDFQVTFPSFQTNRAAVLNPKSKEKLALKFPGSVLCWRHPVLLIMI